MTPASPRQLGPSSVHRRRRAPKRGNDPGTIDGCATTAELREAFLSFFESNGHLRFPSFPLIPPRRGSVDALHLGRDAAAEAVLLGREDAAGAALHDRAEVPPRGRQGHRSRRGRHRPRGTPRPSSRCSATSRSATTSRTARSTTPGSSSREHLGLEPERLWATVFAGDPGARPRRGRGRGRGMAAVGIPRERIVRSRARRTSGRPADRARAARAPSSTTTAGRSSAARGRLRPGLRACERYLEYWNLVFMEFDLAADGSLTPLPKQNIDTGLGLERGAMLLQGVDSIFDTDGFRLIMDWIAEESGVPYGTSPEATKAHRVLADHGRGVTFLVAEGVTPSNEGRGYILRRLIRRAVLQARRIGLSRRSFRLPRIVVEQVGPCVPGARRARRRDRAGRPRRGGAVPRDARARNEGVRGARGRRRDRRGGRLPLAATYGFPIELTVELARERGHRGGRRRLPGGDGAPPRDLARGRRRKALVSVPPTSPRRPASRPSSSATRRWTSLTAARRARGSR